MTVNMKISSRSILGPGRAGDARDPSPISLSTSLSRSLRNSRSIKGGASPAMFPATGKKRGCGFENPEPSSPKVTCIGQVRVKSKKKHLRTLSRRRSTAEVSFRQLQHSRDGFGSHNQECFRGERNNQRWVHLPLTICEALRTFGSEFSCLFPCRSSCSSTMAMDKEEKMVEGGNREGSCGWLVALQDGDGGGRDAGGGGTGREVELAAEDDDDDEMGVRNSRRHVFQDLEIINDCILGTKDEARMSICVPPKNALLLMRCRSDPMKMEALTNRFWEPTMEKNEEEEDEEFVDDEEKIEETKIPQDLQLQEEEKLMNLVEVNDQEHDDLQEDAADLENLETNLEMEMKQSIQEEDDQEQSIETSEEEESMFLWSLFSENVDQDQEFEEEDADSDMEDAQEELFEDIDVQENEAAGESNIERVKAFEEEMVTGFTERSEAPDETREEVVMESKGEENGVLERDSRSKALPECLLLMMCEPKLSMEVSKETWVCSTDFIRHHSSRKKPPPPLPPVKSIDGQDESKVNASAPSGVTTTENDRTAAVQYQAALQQPARSSCSLPAPPSMAAMLEQKLVNTMGYEPLMLTRCKSDPMRSAANRPVSETCFWKNKTLEPLRRASFSIGVAALGF